MTEIQGLAVIHPALCNLFPFLFFPTISIHSLNMAEEEKNSNQPPRSSLASLRPSIYEHVSEHGRTYHAYKAGSMLFSQSFLN
jgi:hypothetical protein